jgi:protein involved in polysaccharide export with SLBB domain
VQPLIRVSVLGEVAKPGLHSIEPGTNLLQLLTLVGGPTDRASLKDARVVRGSRVVPVDLESAMNGSATGRVVLYSNDLLVVPVKRGLNRESMAVILTGVTTAVTIANLFITLRR